jgi:hypothetical protein
MASTANYFCRNRQVFFNLIVGVMFACGPLMLAHSQQPGQVPNNQIQTLAVVNGQPISRQQVAHECMARFGKDVLEDIVNKVLVLEECRKQGIAITRKGHRR